MDGSDTGIPAMLTASLGADYVPLALQHDGYYGRDGPILLSSSSLKGLDLPQPKLTRRINW